MKTTIIFVGIGVFGEKLVFSTPEIPFKSPKSCDYNIKYTFHGSQG